MWECVSALCSICASTVQVPSRVEFFHAEALSPTSIQVGWEPPSQPNGPVLGYRLLWTESPSGKEQVSRAQHKGDFLKCHTNQFYSDFLRCNHCCVFVFRVWRWADWTTRWRDSISSQSIQFGFWQPTAMDQASPQRPSASPPIQTVSLMIQYVLDRRRYHLLINDLGYSGKHFCKSEVVFYTEFKEGVPTCLTFKLKGWCCQWSLSWHIIITPNN